ncbi:hypothetical protein [Streptomyces sp. NBC_01198]|uniref:hypothetical protein n=1 Tax=Streptomyces sp. NBC_01198 TaxID=2903769 RepID=UPI002E1204E8|nr:hypothetical protein OG702_25235 [Streptomyces sp. NBC_01198]
MAVGELRSPLVGRAPRETGRHRLASVVAICGVALVPWLAVLAAAGTGPAWIALDSLEAVGLVTTGLLAAGPAHQARTPAAAVTAALLLLDASLDLATSHGTALLVAVAMAVLAELPLAAACGVLALRRTPGGPAQRRAQQPSSLLPR